MKICNKCGELKPCGFYRYLESWSIPLGIYVCNDCAKAIEILEKREYEKMKEMEIRKQHSWKKQRDKILKENGTI